MVHNPPEVLAVRIRRQRHHALTVDAVVFTDDCGVVYARQITEKRCRGTPGCHGHHTQILERFHARLRHLDLNLERDARAGIRPVVGSHEPAGRSCRGKRLSHLVHGDTKLSGQLAVHVDLNRW